MTNKACVPRGTLFSPRGDPLLLNLLGIFLRNGKGTLTAMGSTFLFHCKGMKKRMYPQVILRLFDRIFIYRSTDLNILRILLVGTKAIRLYFYHRRPRIHSRRRTLEYSWYRISLIPTYCWQQEFRRSRDGASCSEAFHGM